MVNFYDFTLLMEQGGSASVERFPQDFEQVLNFVAGGPWNFTPGEFSPFVSMDQDNSVNEWVFYVRSEYRGMSESGRHYRLSVRINSVPPEPIRRNGSALMQRWKKDFVSYNPKGSPVDERFGLPSVYFEIEEIYELGADTNGRERVASTETEDATPQQKSMQTMIDKLRRLQDEMERDHPSPKWTPQKRVYLRKSQDSSPKITRPVDLAKHIRDEIAKHEKENPGF